MKNMALNSHIIIVKYLMIKEHYKLIGIILILIKEIKNSNIDIFHLNITMIFHNMNKVLVKNLLIVLRK